MLVLMFSAKTQFHSRRESSWLATHMSANYKQLTADNATAEDAVLSFPISHVHIPTLPQIPSYILNNLPTIFSCFSIASIDLSKRRD
ncbi:hypothetical protein ACLKA7_017002 [Drosophila subpalustris]